MNKYILLGFLLLMLPLGLWSQQGGQTTYQFLNLPASGRLTGLGGSLIGVMDDDINLAMSNPASLNEKMHQSLSFSHNWHFADIGFGHFGYGHHLKSLGITTHVGFSYFSYGNFEYADILGNRDGSFSARENLLTIGASKQIAERIFFGANLKAIFSNFESYQSRGIATDLGLTYENPDEKLAVSFVIKNLGTELTTYAQERFHAPLDVQFGLTKRLAYLPFRFSVIFHNLQQWDIRYDDPNAPRPVDILGNPLDDSGSGLSRTVDNFFRHTLFNGELLIGKSEAMKIRFAYNHLRRQELSQSTFRSMAGFSLGFGLRLKSITLDYGLGYHHLAGAAQHLSVSTNFRHFRKKKEII